MTKADEKMLLQGARQFDVHRWSDYPEVNAIVQSLLDEIVKLRRSKRKRIREIKKIQKHLKVVLLDLYVLSKRPAIAY